MCLKNGSFFERQLFLLVFTACVSLFSLTGLVLPYQAGEAAAPSHITLTWADDARTTQTITWKTDADTMDGQVRYWVLAAEPPGRVENQMAQVRRIDTNWGAFNLHTLTLNGLLPGVRYAYQAGDGQAWSEQYSFVTAPAANGQYQFLVFGDSQSVNYDTWRTTLQQAYRAHPKAAFFINMGDLVDRGQAYGEWDAWFNAVQGVAENIPCMPLVGNHETYAIGGGFAMPSLFTDQFQLPQNGPAGLRGQVYSFNYGGVHFVMLDTQAGEEGRFVPDMLEKQKAWLAADLAAATQQWKLVFVHRALYNNKTADDLAIRNAFAPVIDQYRADVVFSAHDHVYARTYPLRQGMAVEGPNAGTIHVATGRSGSKKYADSIAREWNSFFFNPLDEPNYLMVEVDGRSLTIRAYRQSGGLIDEWRMVKGEADAAFAMPTHDFHAATRPENDGSPLQLPER